MSFYSISARPPSQPTSINPRNPRHNSLDALPISPTPLSDAPPSSPLRGRSTSFSPTPTQRNQFDKELTQLTSTTYQLISPMGSVYAQLRRLPIENFSSDCIRIVFDALFPDSLEDKWTYLTSLATDVLLQQNFFQQMSKTISRALCDLGNSSPSPRDIEKLMEPEWGWLYLRIQTQRLIDFAKPQLLACTRSARVEKEQVPQVAKPIIANIRAQLGDADPESIGQKLTKRIERLVEATLSEGRHNIEMTIEKLFCVFPKKSRALTGRSLDIVNSTIQAAQFFREPPFSVRAFDRHKCTTRTYLMQAVVVFVKYIEPMSDAPEILPMFHSILSAQLSAQQKKQN